MPPIKGVPRWAIAVDIEKLVPEIDDVAPIRQTTADWLSRLAREGRIERRYILHGTRNWQRINEAFARGRRPVWEYKVTSVKREVERIQAR
jgi:hypothetical protein